MRVTVRLLTWILLIVLTGMGFACTEQPRNSNSVASETTPGSPVSPSPTATAPATDVKATNAVTLPVLNALFTDEKFKAALKSELKLSDDQISGLQKSASDEVERLRETNAEQQNGDAADARTLAYDAIRNAVGQQNATAVSAFISEHWMKGAESSDSTEKAPEFSLLPGPNAIPEDTRVVVNIPAYRMDLFQDGSLVRSFRIGIGYPAFPLPTGLRKAQQIIFNPTWTPPDEPWVNSMKGITVGERIEAGSELNPLGPVKIPIGLPSLIHGGKSPAKLGSFASHGCVGLTNTQVKEFARLLSNAGGTGISNKAIETYLKDKTRTRVVKLGKPIPVELRYETLVVEGGKLHIYKDVYDQNSNTEENLQVVLAANGVSMEDLAEEERAQVLADLNAMSTHPKKQTPAPSSNTAVPANAKGQDKATGTTKAKSRKERVIDITALAGKGYPAPVDLLAR